MLNWRLGGRLVGLGLWLSIGILVTLAIVMTLARLALAQPRYLTPWAETVVAAVTDEPVAFDSVSGRLNGFSPEVMLAGVRLGEAERELRIDSLVLRLNAWDSLWQWEPVLAGVRGRGASVEVKRHADGSVRVQGRQDNLFAKIPFPERIELSDLAVDWRDGQRAPLRLRSVTIQALADGDGARFSGRARLADGGGELRLRAALASLPRAAEPFRGRILLDLSDVEARRLRTRTSNALAGMPRFGGRLNGRLWLRWRDGRLARAAASGRWQQPQWADGAPGRALSGELHWQRRGEGWLAQARGRAGQSDEDAHIALARSGPEGGWRVAARDLPVAVIKRELKARSGDLPERHRRWLEAVEPSGRIARLAAGWRDREWRLETRLVDVGLAPSGHAPGIDGVDLAVEADSDGGRVSASLADSRLRWPSVLREPMALTTAAAELAWRRRPGDTIDVELKALDWAGPLMAGQLRGGLRFGGGREPRIRAQARLDRGDAVALLGRLTPQARAEASLDWVAGALDRATLTGATLRLDGPLSALSFDDPAGTAELRMAFREGRLNYAGDWPRLEGLGGHFSLSRAGLRLVIERGSIAGIALDGGGARIPDLNQPELSVTARAHTSAADWRGLLARTPLPVPGVLDHVSLQGAAGLALELGFSLDETGPPSVSGRVDLNGVSIHQPASGYRVEAVDGSVSFDERGLRWQKVTGNWRGRRVTSRGWTEGQGDQTRIRTITRVTASVSELLAPEMPLDLPVTGRSEWLLDLSLPGFAVAEGRWRAELSSDLAGLGVSLPAPLGKAASEARGLSLTASGAADGLGPARLRYGNGLDVVAGFDEGRVARIGVSLGGETADLPDERGIRVDGVLASLDVRKLRGYAALAVKGAPTKGPSLPPLTQLDLRVGVVKAGRYAVRDINVGAEPVEGGWRLRFKGPNAQGRAQLGEGGDVDVEMERLAVERLPGAPESSVSPPAPGVPSLAIRIADLRLDARKLGQFRLRVNGGDGQGLALDELVLDNSSMLLRATGDWQAEADRSNLDVTLETVDAGMVLERFGAARTMAGGAGRLSAELAWDGHLLSPAAESLDGKLDLTLRDGNLPTLEPGAGRVFGLLSLSLVPRRLMLDFAPITGEGLPFDRIRAAFTIEDGVARPDPCYLAGPVARIRVQGSVDLAKRVYDQRITVTPRVSSTLPLVGGLAAGPPAALLLWLGQDVVADGVAPFTSLEYRLTGPWADPLLERAGGGVLGPATEGVAP